MTTEITVNAVGDTTVAVTVEDVTTTIQLSAEIQTLTITNGATAVVAAVPSGGSDGYFLAKASDSNFDTEWVPPPDAALESRMSVVEYNQAEDRDTIAEHSSDIIALQSRASVMEYDIAELRDDVSGSETFGRRCTADHEITFVSTSTYHNIFPSSIPAFNVEPGTYTFEMWLRLTHGTTSTSKALRLNGGTCTISAANWMSNARNATIIGLALAGGSGMTHQASNLVTANVIVANSTGGDWQAQVQGMLTVSVAGTIMPQVGFPTANPTGTILVKEGTYLALTKVNHFNANP